MKNTLIYICMLLLTGACTDHCRDCDTPLSPGNFRLIRNWQNLPEGMEKPEYQEIYFYSNTQPYVNLAVTKDTSSYYLAAGEYRILIFNPSEGITFTGLEKSETARAELPLSAGENGRIATIPEAPACFSSFITAKVPDKGEVEYTVIPAPIIKTINFKINIINKTGLTIHGCTATLYGVEASVLLCGQHSESTPAQLPFRLHQEGENSYYKTVSVLGLQNPLLNIGIECSSDIQETDVSLSDRLNFDTSPVQDCIITLTVEADGLNTKVEITDWQTGEGGTIILR